MNKRALCLKSDSYKASHPFQFVDGMENSFYYLCPRINDVEIEVAGLQYIVKEHFSGVPTVEDVEFAAKYWKEHGEPFYKEGWLKIVELGYFPLKFRGVPEGTIMPSNKIQITVESTGKGFGWLVGWAESLLVQVWYPSTVGTRSREMVNIAKKWLVKNGTPELSPFKIHDFGYRACTCQEQAEIGSFAHLINSSGTDTQVGNLMIRDYYTKDGKGMWGFSIPAAEHSTIGSWGKEFEEKAFEKMIDEFGEAYPFFAVVSDTYDLEHACKELWGKKLFFKVKEMSAMLVVRPDSGDPNEEVVKVARWFREIFGTTVNDKKSLVLNNVRIIHGDGMKGPQEVDDVYRALDSAGFSADNLAIGSGGGLLQRVNRDTYQWAMKMSAVQVAGVWHDVFKDPVDAPWKASKKGRLTTTANFREVRVYENAPVFNDLLVDIWENGKFINEITFDEVRANAAK